MSRLNGKRVCVTGAGGFLGRHVVDLLRSRTGVDVIAPPKRHYDLTDPGAVRKMFWQTRPQILIHLAGSGGGIQTHIERPGQLYFENALMGLLLIEAARVYNLEKVVIAGSVSTYPRETQMPQLEESLWTGALDESTAPYAVAKLGLLAMGQAYQRQYGLNVIHPILANLYGPGDKFEPDSSPVVASTIRKCLDARERDLPAVRMWGDGAPTRDFLFVRDAAQGIVDATDRYDDPRPVNIGSGREISIKVLAHMIRDLTGYRGSLEWDASRPSGPQRRRIYAGRAFAHFGWKATTPLEAGLRETVSWYEALVSNRVLQAVI